MSDRRKEALEYIIEERQIKTVFQPIISLKNGSILGHEALSRITCESEIDNPEMLFAVAGEYDRLWDLELLCRTKALEAAYIFLIPPYSKMLFLNVNPNILHDINFKKGFTSDFLQEYKIEPQNVIFEITERNVILDMGGFLSTIDHYRGQDYKIAIDDAGAGYSGLNLISDVNPNYIKLDMKLIRDIDTDLLKTALVKGMVELSKASSISLIAEGIETKEELETLIALGVQYGQGYLIQKPKAELEEIPKAVIGVIMDAQDMKKKSSENVACSDVRSLCSYTGIVSPNVSAKSVYQIFKQNTEFFGLCVIDNEIPLGIITSEKLARKMSGHYGFALHQNKPISELMDKRFLMVDHQTPIATVSYLAMSRPNDSLYDFIVVTENEKYVGTVTIRDLLTKSMEIEVNNAKQINPLSGLPGNNMVEQKLEYCIKSRDEFTISYIDIDNFKAYNDVYGFESGDLVLKMLAELLKSMIPGKNFIGHIGGDDYTVIMEESVDEAFFDEIKERFKTNVFAYYNPIDLKNGYITTTNRRGEMEQFPLLTITTVAVSNHYKEFKDIYELTKLLAALKRDKKQKKLMQI